MPPKTPDHDPSTTGIPMPLTPESGYVYEGEWNDDARNLVWIDPQHDLRTPGTEQAYDETWSYVVGRGRDMVAQDSNFFNDMVRDVAADYAYANDTTNGLSYDERARTYRVTELEADVLAPPASEPQPANPELVVQTEVVKRQVDGILKELMAKSERHPGEGVEQLMASIAPLQRFAGEGLAPYVRGAIEQSFERAERALAEAQGRMPDLTADVYSADRQAEAARSQAEAAAAVDPEQYRASAVRRYVTRPLVKGVTRLRVGGNAWRESRMLDYTTHDAAGQKTSDDTWKRGIADRKQAASNATREAGLRRYEAMMNQEQAVGGLHRSAQNMRQLAKVLLDVDGHGEMQVVTSHGIAFDPQHTPVQHLQQMEGVLAANAPGLEYQNAEGDPDKNDPILEQREVLQHETELVRGTLRRAFKSTDPEALAELYAQTIALEREVEELEQQRHVLKQQGPSLEYTKLCDKLTFKTRLLNQAGCKYAAKTVADAPFGPGGVRDFGGRRRIIQLEDGSYLVGDEPQPADPNDPDAKVEVSYHILWPNGDIGFPATPEDITAGHAFEARSHRPAEDTNKPHNKPEEKGYGNFVRISPAGTLRVPRRLRKTETWKNYEEDSAAPIIKEEQAKRAQKIQEFDPSDPTDVSEARTEYDEAIEAFHFQNNMSPRAAETFLTRSAPHLAGLVHRVREIHQDQVLMDVLDPARFRAEYDAEQAAIEALKRQRKVDMSVVNARQQALYERRNRATTFGYNAGMGSPNRIRLDNARQAITELEQARYDILRAAAYDGITQMDDNGMITLRADNKHRDKEIRGFLGLPEGEWHFSPNGRSIYVTWDKKNNKQETILNPAQNVALAA